VARAVVDTAYGKVSGATVDGVTAFLGVPFASTGPGRRFRPASPPERWTGIREAQAPGPMAPQQRTDFSNVMPDEFQELGGLGFGVDPPPQDEDCLGLSVWTPGADAEPRPVMVWMHGAPFNSGSNSMGEGASLARTGDVVVVMPNHRLGVLGFLHLDSVAPGAYPGSGNMGMLDLVRSLEWVRDNISNFGGDAGNVTVFGCSGGGMKTSTLLAMPAARGLFHKAIIESGPYVRAVPAERATTYANRFLRALDLEATAVDELERLPVERLVAAQEQVLKELQAEAIGFGDLAAAGPEVFVRGVAHGGPLWDIGPTVDGAVLTQQPWDPAAPPSAAEVPLIIGLNRDEGALWLMMYPNVNDLSWDQLESMATALRGDRGQAVIDLYRRTGRGDPQDIVDALISTDHMWMDSVHIAERKVAGGPAPVWMYQFAYRSDAVGGWLRARSWSRGPLRVQRRRAGQDHRHPPRALPGGRRHELSVAGVRPPRRPEPPRHPDVDALLPPRPHHDGVRRAVPRRRRPDRVASGPRRSRHRVRPPGLKREATSREGLGAARRPSAPKDHVVELLPVHVHRFVAGGPEEIQLRIQGNDMAYVVFPARLLLGGAVGSLYGTLRIPVVLYPLPGVVDRGVLGGDRVVVEVPAAGNQPFQDLPEEPLLPVVGQMVQAEG
jgi:para-nitrobenzyl esterase